MREPGEQVTASGTLPTEPVHEVALHHRPRSPGRGVVASAAFGFLVGAVFWHFIGFWGFVREVLLKGPEPEAHRVAQTGAACTALTLDRVSGVVQAGSCPTDAPWLGEAPGGKGDMQVPVRPVAEKRWSVTVQAETAPDEE